MAIYDSFIMKATYRPKILLFVQKIEKQVSQYENCPNFRTVVQIFASLINWRNYVQ